MTQLTIDVGTRRYSSAAQVRRWWKAMSSHVVNVFATLAAHSPYSLDSSHSAESEWTRYEPASKWLEEHPESESAALDKTESRV